MPSKGRQYHQMAVPLFLLLVAVGGVIVGWQSGGREIETRDADSPASAALKPRIRSELPIHPRAIEQITELQSESLDESLSFLADVGMYFFPYIGDSRAVAVVVPLRPRIGVSDQHHILSNRRFSKVAEELAELFQEEAAERVVGELRDTLEKYIDLMEAYPSDRPLVFVTGNVPKSDVHFLGLRFKLLSLCYLAGFMNLRECAPVVQDVARHGIAQYENLEEIADGDDQYHFAFAHRRLVTAGLYSRQILALALIGTADSEG